MRRPGSVGSTHGDREAPAWHRRGRPFFRLWMRLPDRDGTEDGGALNGIVGRWRASKSGRDISWVFPVVSRAVSL